MKHVCLRLDCHKRGCQVIVNNLFTDHNNIYHEDLLRRYAYECTKCGFETQLKTAMRNIEHGNHVRLMD